MGYNFLLFEEAKTFVYTLNLKSQKEWQVYCKSGKKPEAIPVSPHIVYKNKGWKSCGDWLGTNIIANRNKVFLIFEEARIFVHKLGLKTIYDWYEYCKLKKRPKNIPSNPETYYKDKGWISMGDWLGTGSIWSGYKTYWSFKEARAFVHNLGLKGCKEWQAYCKSGKKPEAIPFNPFKVYKSKGWISFVDWLGNKYKSFLSFEEAKAFVHGLNLKSYETWKKYCVSNNKPNNIPSNPNVYYKNEGWISIKDWIRKK